MKKQLLLILSIVTIIAGTVAGSSTVSAQSLNYSMYSIGRDLSFGSSGADVVYLQNFLQHKGYLVIPFHVSKGYYGNLTRNAVIVFQLQNGLYPTGVFDYPTRIAYSNWIGSGSNSSICYQGFYNLPHCGYNVPGTTHDDDSDELEGDEASLENFEVDKGNDTDIEEGDNDAEIIDVEFDVEDGDIQITRAEFAFEFTGNSDAEDRPWEIFDSVRLLADGDEIAQIDSDDRNEWSREDDDVYHLRFSNLDYIVREDDTAQLTLEVDISRNIGNNTSWKVFVPDEGIRAIDADDETQRIGDDDETVTITIRED